MKRKKCYIISAIILAIVVSMITYAMQVGFIKTAPKNIIENNLNTYKNFFDINLSNSGQTLNEIILKDSLNNKLAIKSAFCNNQNFLLVCRFSKSQCQSCVDFALQFILNMKNSIGIDNILFLGYNRNNYLFYNEADLYKIKNMKVFNVQKLNIPAEKYNYPYYFILDKNLEIYNIFMPDKSTPEITISYLKSITKTYF